MNVRQYVHWKEAIRDIVDDSPDKSYRDSFSEMLRFVRNLLHLGDRHWDAVMLSRLANYLKAEEEEDEDDALEGDARATKRNTITSDDIKATATGAQAIVICRLLRSFPRLRADVEKLKKEVWSSWFMQRRAGGAMP